MHCLNQENLRKLKEAISLSVYKRNILFISLIKLFRLEDISQKLWLSCPAFIIFLLLLLLKVYISLTFYIDVFQKGLFRISIV